MNPTLELFSRILFRDLKPSCQNLASLRYSRLGIDLNHPPLYLKSPQYEVVGPKPQGEIRQFYRNLIEYASIQFLNQFLEETRGREAKMRRYLSNRIISGELEALFKDMADLLPNKGVLPEEMEQNTALNRVPSPEEDEAYVFLYLLCACIRLYQEISEKTIDSSIAEELSSRYLGTGPNGFTITRSKVRQVKMGPKPKPIRNSGMNFTPISGDPHRNIKVGYDAVVLKKEAFSILETTMFEYGIIDKNYDFQSQYGNLTRLAAIVVEFWDRGYFNQEPPMPTMKWGVFSIRKFFEERYRVKENSLGQIERRLRRNRRRLKTVIKGMEKL